LPLHLATNPCDIGPREPRRRACLTLVRQSRRFGLNPDGLNRINSVSNERENRGLARRSTTNYRVEVSIEEDLCREIGCASEDHLVDDLVGFLLVWLSSLDRHSLSGLDQRLQQADVCRVRLDPSDVPTRVAICDVFPEA